MTALSTLRTARGLVRAGWCQGDPGQQIIKGRMHFCVVAALEKANDREFRAYKAFIGANRIADGHVSVWNDDPRRTKEEVLAAFAKAIKAQSK